MLGAGDNRLLRCWGAGICGMPPLDVDKVKSIVVTKCPMGHGCVGISNELYTDPRTGTFFVDAKKGVSQLRFAAREFVV
ncbi:MULTISPECIES: NAD(P)(+) transhydrogenase (Re/Si-specific) subunit beta [unclassified Streptomyces]|uniref:NAD(P)(+) transhydrogenase (Re/Si-specific) subunit beta n=1 Tax=unclassified Streptomyces TaxID=2593676 RepID=UPI0036E21E53